MTGDQTIFLKENHNAARKKYTATLTEEQRKIVKSKALLTNAKKI